MTGRRSLVIGLALLVALSFRLLSLGRYVTPDEPAWVYRSVRFYDALTVQDWASVPSTGHPGVTTMWLGAAGVAVQRLLHPAESAVHLDWIRGLAWLAPENGEAFRHLAFFLTPGRVAVALTTTLGLFLLYFPVRWLFGDRVALVTVGLLAFDPFLVGHSGLLHTDALLATFCGLSIVCLLGAMGGGPRRWVWAPASGAAAGLAMLTKSSGAFLMPFALLALGWAWIARRMRLRRLLASWVGWGISAAAIYLALYPAMWIAPVQTVRDLLGAPSYHATAALMPTFFAGRVALYHGPEFYAVALPIRLSPIIMVGLALSLPRLFRRNPFRAEQVWLWLFVLGYGVMLALSVKKYDRYLLPIFPSLTLIVALSLVSPRPRVSPSPRPRVSASPRLLLITLQLFFLLPFVAYPLAYANPLLGGPAIASRLISLDWGEGVGAAARWLNRLPDADQLTVAVGNIPSFASLFAGRTVALGQSALADYLVYGAGDPVAGDNPPAYVATIGFRPRAVVYTNTAPRDQAAYLAETAGVDDLILLDADLPLLRCYDRPGEIASVADLPNEVALASWLREHVPQEGNLWVVHSPGASPITAAWLPRQVEVMATPLTTTSVASATITQYALRTTHYAMRDTQHAFLALFGGQLALVDGEAPHEATSSAPIRVVLRWQAAGAIPLADYRAVVTLRDMEGQVWGTADQPVLNRFDFPTSVWATGEWVDAVYTLSLPPAIPPGHYTVEVGLYNAATGAGIGAAGPDGTFRGTRLPVREIAILPSAAPPGLGSLEIPRRLEFPAGPLTLLGVSPPPARVLSGDSVSFALFWQAEDAPGVDYRVRLLLVGEGRIEVETSAPLSPYPTSRWRAGDRFETRHRLYIPPDLPPGRYRLALNVLGREGSPVWAGDRVLAMVEVLPRQRSFERPEEIPHPLELTFGGGVRLLGYGLGRTEAVPGEPLLLTLYWQADGPTDRSYTLFVHLLGPDGLPHGQVDRIPGDGLAPTSSWAAGQVIVEEVVLPIATDAPPGTYRIAVGFYDAAYGDRLPVADPAGCSLPGDQAVLPTTIALAGGSQ